MNKYLLEIENIIKSFASLRRQNAIEKQNAFNDTKKQENEWLERKNAVKDENSQVINLIKKTYDDIKLDITARAYAISVFENPDLFAQKINEATKNKLINPNVFTNSESVLKLFETSLRSLLSILKDKEHLFDKNNQQKFIDDASTLKYLNANVDLKFNNLLAGVTNKKAKELEDLKETQRKKVYESDALLNSEYQKAVANINDAVKNYNANSHLLKKSLNSDYPSDFIAKYTLPLFDYKDKDAASVNKLINDFSSDIKTLYEFFTVNFDSRVPQITILNGNNEKAIVDIFEYMTYRFLVSYPLVYKHIVAIDAKAGSEIISRYMSKVGNTGGGKFLLPGFSNFTFTNKENIKSILNALLTKINDASARLGNSGEADIFEYNHNHSDNPESIVLLTIKDYPNGFDNDNNDALKQILEKGPRCGIIPVINRNENYIDDRFTKDVTQQSCYSSRIEIANYDLSSAFPANEKDFDREAFLERIDNEVKETSKSISLEDVMPHGDQSKRRREFGKQLIIPIGKKDGKPLNLILDSDGDTHVIVAGATGSGKTVLVRTILLSAAKLYSPEELEIHLFDFKDGVGFANFSKNDLKHVKFISLNNNVEDASDVLAYLSAERTARNDKFTAYGVENIVEYNKIALEKNLPLMPRMIVAIDEYQDILDISTEVLSEIARKGRSCGISLILSSQKVPTVSSFKNILGQMGHKFMFKIEPDDAMAFMHECANKVSDLELEKGLAFYQLGTQAPVKFKTAYSGDSNQIDSYIKDINDMYVNKEYPLTRKVGGFNPFIVSDTSITRLKDNRLGDNYNDDGKIPFVLGRYNITEEMVKLQQDEENSVLFVVGDYLKSKTVITSIVLGEMRVMKKAGVAPNTMIRVLDMCNSIRYMNKPNSFNEIIEKKMDLEENGQDDLGYISYFGENDKDSVIDKVKQILRDRFDRVDKDLSPTILVILCAENITMTSREKDEFWRLMNKAGRYGVYFVLHMTSLMNDIYKFISSEYPNLAKDYIILSNGVFDPNKMDSVEKETPIIVNDALEQLSRNNKVIPETCKAIMKSKSLNAKDRKDFLEPTFAFVIDDRVINKYQIAFYKDGFMDSFIKEMKEHE